MIHDIALASVLILGTALICIANVAIYTFGDVYMKSHVLTKAGTLGISLLILAVALRLPLSQFQSLELLICLCLQWLTIPISGQYINYLEFLNHSKNTTP